MQFSVFLAIYVFLALALPSCAPSKSLIVKSDSKKQGFYHEVKKGETLWKISKKYNMELEAILTSNALTNGTIIKPGESVFIPLIQKDDYQEILGGDDFIWPIEGKVIAFYGMRNKGVINRGIDIKPDRGLSILASMNGEVIFSSKENTSQILTTGQLFRLSKYYGHIVVMMHNNDFFTIYANAADILVNEGELVEQGEVIARLKELDSTSEDYLHFEIRKGNKVQNPFHFLP